MEVLSKDDLKYKIKDRDYEIVKDHLIEVEKRSYGSFRNRKWVVLDCLNFINKDFKNMYLDNAGKIFSIKSSWLYQLFDLTMQF